jgi:hypothetical protein
MTRSGVGFTHSGIATEPSPLTTHQHDLTLPILCAFAAYNLRHFTQVYREPPVVSHR